MKCLVGFQKHLLVKPVTTEGFITRSEKMLFPRKPLSKSTFIVLFIPRHGIYYGLKISTGECPVLEPSQWPAPEETKRGNAESYTGTMVPKQERNVCARRRGSCMELRHTETSVWHFHQYSTSPFARRLLISAYQCHWEAMAAWLYVCNPVELHWRTAVGSVPPAQRHSEPRGILRCRDLATALPSAMAGGGESPPGSQHLAGNLAVLLHLGCGVQAPALLLPSLRAGFCAGLQEHREQRSCTGPRLLSTRLLKQGRAGPQQQSFAPSIWRRGNCTDPQQHSWFSPGGAAPGHATELPWAESKGWRG